MIYLNAHEQINVCIITRNLHCDDISECCNTHHLALRTLKRDYCLPIMGLLSRQHLSQMHHRREFDVEELKRKWILLKIQGKHTSWCIEMLYCHVIDYWFSQGVRNVDFYLTHETYTIYTGERVRRIENKAMLALFLPFHSVLLSVLILIVRI